MNMTAPSSVPGFEGYFPELHQFVLHLVDLYQQEKLCSWKDLEVHVMDFFTPQQMERMESAVPGWRKMASYAEGVTLVHVMCVFLGLYRMPDFFQLDRGQQEQMKWIVLLHDLEKEVGEGQRDAMHAFRSAVTAARLLPSFGFVTSSEYPSLIGAWGEFTRMASTRIAGSSNGVQDNRKIPEILYGIQRMFGRREPGTWIVETILFHMSVAANEWPPPTPLTGQEMKSYFDRDLLPLLKVMHLADSDGWTIFHPSRERLRADTLRAFENLELVIA